MTCGLWPRRHGLGSGAAAAAFWGGLGAIADFRSQISNLRFQISILVMRVEYRPFRPQKRVGMLSVALGHGYQKFGPFGPGCSLDKRWGCSFYVAFGHGFLWRASGPEEGGRYGRGCRWG